MTANEAYAWLLNHSREASTLGGIGELLGWDQRTFIPPRGHAARAGQLALLARLQHRWATDPGVGERLALLEGSAFATDPLSPSAANLREWRKAYLRATRIPERLAAELAEATSRAESVWEQARPRNDWKAFEPELSRVLALKREQAQALSSGGEPYDALLDEFEPGQTAADLQPLFAQLKLSLAGLLARLAHSTPGSPGLAAASGTNFPRRVQEAFLREALTAIGYDFGGGRLDPTAHPFTVSIAPGDVRITTRYLEESFLRAFLAGLHEGGHGLYEQGLPAEHWGTPAGRAASTGIHESQSRLWENLVGRSTGFWRHFFPKAQHAFSGLQSLRIEAFLANLRQVRPSLIRVEADEITYNLHIAVRFDLELALMRSELAVSDLPQAWNQKMLELLRLSPPDFNSGVMQDVHWASGLFGYFPTYTLGNLYAAQFFAQAQVDLADQEAAFERGDFSPLLSWLREKVHARGGLLPPRQLLREITGRDLSAQPLISHLEQRYLQR